MRFLFAITLGVLTPMLVAFLLLVRPALAASVRCTTYEVKSPGRLQTLCDDGTRAVHYFNKTLGRWETSVKPPPGQTCTGRLHPKTRHWKGRCR